MKALFVVRHPGQLRALTPVCRELGKRGHHVHLAFHTVKDVDSQAALRRLADEVPGMTFGELASVHTPGWSMRASWWQWLAQETRLVADYLRFLEPRYRNAEGLRVRGERKAPALGRRLGRLRGVVGPRGIAALRRAIQRFERCLPAPEHVKRFVAGHAPDVLVVTRMVAWGSGQADYLRAARELGVRSAYLVFSWDNLTNKSLVHGVPDLTLVWNDLQVSEAAQLQGLPAERVRATGAPIFDHWFEWTPSSTREEFCARVGLRADRPIVLYVCSSKFVAPKEAPFVERWIAALRASGGALADAGILVRPHPQNAKQWKRVSLDAEQVRVWPRDGREPLDVNPRQQYFDSMFHAGAVVGINTSALIESAIVGRPVHTVLADEFRATQQGTLHFHYLRDDEFGHVYLARTLEDHAALLARSLEGGDDHRARNERFLRRFVRPAGLDRAATPLVADALEELVAAPPPAPSHGPALAPLVRAALGPLAARSERNARASAQPPSLPRELRRELRKVAQGPGSTTVVAEQWHGDELGELLLWIPFLRWAQTAVLGLHERLVVVAPPERAAWYEGVGARVVAPGGEPGGARLSPALVESRRAELLAHEPGERYQHRLLDFAPLTGADATPFEGEFGAAAVLAVLSGAPARVAASDAPELKLARAWLAAPPFGPLEVA